MYKHQITYTDFNGQQRTEDLYFNLSEAEVIELQANSEFGIQEDLQKAIDNQDIATLLKFVKLLISRSYGIKSDDGRFFRKSPEIMSDFLNSAFYSPLLLSLFENEGDRATAFVTGILPADLIRRAQAQATQTENNSAASTGLFDQSQPEGNPQNLMQNPQTQMIPVQDSQPQQFQQTNQNPQQFPNQGQQWQGDFNQQ